MAAEGVSSAEGSHHSSLQPSSRSRSRPMSSEPPEAGPGPATMAARSSRSRSLSHESDAETYTSASEGSIVDDDDEDYERLRRERMQANASLLAQLDLIGGASPSFGTTATSPPAPRRRGRPSNYIERYDRYGYVVSLPPPGKTQVLAAVEVRTDRMTRRAIDHGEYTDCMDWAVGEERRWRFGDGEGELQPGEQPVVGDVGPDFRWKEYADVVDIEEARKMAARNAMGDYTPTPPPRPEVPAYKKAYSELPKGTCHQCRRRSDKPKMQCRNVDPECMNLFCSTCCRRYNYFEFDEDSRSFICPVCMGCCNCKNCLDKRNLSDVAAKLKHRFMHRPDELLEGETVQQFVERVGRKDPPFDRVRLVNVEEDIVAPPLTREWEEYLEEQRRTALGIKKRGKQRSKADGRSKRKSKGGDEQGEIVSGDGEEVGEGKGKDGKGKGSKIGKGAKGKDGKGKGGKGVAALKPILPAGGEGEDLVAGADAPSAPIANQNGQLPKAKVKKIKKRKAADTEGTSRPPKASKNDADNTSTPADSAGSGQILLRFQLPSQSVHEVDSDGDSVRGYSSDEDLDQSRSRSPSSSVDEQAPESENINDFLARMASAVVPTLPTLGPEQLSDAQLQAMDTDCMPTLSMVSSRDVELGAVDAVTSSVPTSPALGQGQIESLPSIDPTPHITAHGQLRFTLAVGQTAGLETLHNVPSGSPRTPRRTGITPSHDMDNSHGTENGGNNRPSVRFRISQPSPPGQDPLPELYPTFPELERSSYSSYASHSLPYPPSYSPPSMPYPPTYSPYNFTPSGARPNDNGGREMVSGKDGARNSSWNGQWDAEASHLQHASRAVAVEGEGQQPSQPAQSPETPRKRRRPPPAAHIVRAPKHLQDKFEHASLHQKA